MNQVLAVAFTALSLLVLCLSWLLLAMIAAALIRRVGFPRSGGWHPYRINLHATSLRACALVLLLTQVGLWLLRLDDPAHGKNFPVWVLAPFLLLGLLWLQRRTSLSTFLAAVAGRKRFPRDSTQGYLVRVRIALFIGSWVCLVPAVLAYSLPLAFVPNLVALFGLSLLVIFPPLLLLNDEWIRLRLAGGRRK